MKLSLLFLFVAFTASLYSQQSHNMVYGTLNPGELEMTYDPTDSTAEAVILCEKQHTYITSAPDYCINVEYHGRIKILKASGSDRGNISLVQRKSKDEKEKIYDIEGITYNLENGKVVKTVLPAGSIYEEKVSDWKSVKKILLSNVKEGSVIEYRYKRRTPFSVNDTPEEWSFQGNIPFKWSELTVSLPHDIEYRMLFTGYLPLHINTSEKGSENGANVTKYRFVVKDAPSFKDEAYITSKKDYVSKIEFGLMSYYSYATGKKVKFSHSFGDIAKHLNTYKHFGEVIKEAGYPKDLPATFEPVTDSLEKLNAIFKYMTSHFEWNGLNRLLPDDELKTVFKNKKGNSAELNFLLLQLLRASGFKADPVILSTRENGKIREEYPVLNRFNYVLVKVELKGKPILMDVTDPNLSPGLLPQRCLSNTGYVIQKDTVEAVSLKPVKSPVFISIDAELDTTGTIKGTFSQTIGGHNGLTYRSFIKGTNEKALQATFQKMSPDWEIDSWKMENYEDPFKPFRLSFGFSELLPVTKNRIYFNPLFSNQTTENLFNEKERLYPVDISQPYEVVILLNLKLPENFAIEQAPKSISVSLPEKGGKYTYVVETENNVLKVMSRILVANSYYPAEQYRALRELYQQIIQKEAEQVILKKL